MTDGEFFSIVQVAEVGPGVRALSLLHIVQYCKLEGEEDSQYTHINSMLFFLFFKETLHKHVQWTSYEQNVDEVIENTDMHIKKLVRVFNDLITSKKWK